MTPGYLYLHVASIGDAVACAAVRAELGPVLRALEVAGYRMVVVSTLDEAEDELLEHMFDYVSFTGGRFPLIVVLVQPHEPVTIDLDELLRSHAFQRVA